MLPNLIILYFILITKTAIVRVVSSRIRGGDLGKSGPGARAKADAARKARKDSIGVDAYSPHNIYCRYHIID